MAKWWLGVALTVGGLAVAGPAPAQYLPPGDPGAPAVAPANYLPAAPVPAGVLPAGGPPGGQPWPAVPPPPPGVPPGVPPGGPPGIEPVGTGGGPDNAFPAPDCCPTCCARECFHIDGDYLLWYTRKRSLPALVTTGVATDPIPGALGEPGTQTVLQGTGLDDVVHSGARVTLAVDLDNAQVWSVEGSGFVLEDKAANATFSGTGAPGSRVLARPFFNANSNSEDADPISFPNVLAGSLTVGLTQRFYGADANVRYLYWRSPGYDGRIDVLAGARFLALDEGLTFDEGLQELPALGQPGNLFGVAESMQTTNRFYGGQVGLAYQGNVGAVFLHVLGKFAVGENVQTLTNSATTTATDAAGNVSAAADRGLLVQPSNAGRFTRTELSFVPELGVTLGYEFNKNLRLAAGYNLIVWTNVLRPENQIDRTVNVQALQPFDQVGVARPAVNLQNTTFWAQGLSVSLQLSF